MEPIKFFESIEHLEPKCSSCGTKVEYGVSTVWDEELQTLVCSCCGNPA